MSDDKINCKIPEFVNFNEVASESVSSFHL